MTSPHRLITIKFSHYNEKARWALDRCGVPFVEDPHLPLLHFPAVRRALPRGGTADRVSSRYSTPVLITADGPFTDSTDIARFAQNGAPADRQLIPENGAAEIEELDAWFGTRLGPATRCYAYHHLLDDRPLLRKLAPLNVPGVESKVWVVAAPIVSRVIRRALRVNARSAAKSLGRIDEVYDQVNERLSDGRKYLVGDQFSLADLSFAALSAPSLLVSADEGFAARLPTIEEAPAPLRDLAVRLRATPAGRHALSMFATERGRPTG